MIFAGILAGGIGSRVENSKLPKQFLTIHGIPMVIITIKKFLKTNKIDKVIIGINSEYTKLLNKILIKLLSVSSVLYRAYTFYLKKYLLVSKCPIYYEHLT